MSNRAFYEFENAFREAIMKCEPDYLRGAVAGAIRHTMHADTTVAFYNALVQNMEPGTHSLDRLRNLAPLLEAYERGEEPKPIGKISPPFTMKYGDAPDAIRKRLDSIRMTGGLIADEYIGDNFKITVIGFQSEDEAKAYKTQDERPGFRFARRWRRVDGDWVSA